MELRGAPSGPAVVDAAAEKVLNAVLDAGINFIDTSIDYGQSEDLIGRFIAHRRREYFLASKCGCVPGAPMGAEHVHTADNIKAGVEQSLRRMKTETRCEFLYKVRGRLANAPSLQPISYRSGFLSCTEGSFCDRNWARPNLSVDGRRPPAKLLFIWPAD
jgi:hypothetical protein